MNLLEIGLNESIGTRMSRFSYNFVVKTYIVSYYAYLNFQDKNIKPPNAITKFVVLSYSFVFCWCRQRFKHSRWCHHIFNSSSCANTKWRAWRWIARCECLPMVVQKRINWKGGAHLNGSVHMGPLSVA